MRTICKIARTELQILFYSPIAWLVLVIFAFQSGTLFVNMFSGLLANQEAGYGASNITQAIFANVDYGIFPMIQGYLYLYVPLLTMGLMSRELSSGSITLLYSSPVTNMQIILGKYLSMMIYGLVLIIMLFCFVLFSALSVKDFDFSAVLSGLLGLYLLLCAYASVGLFMSSLTSYQVVAAILTLCMLAMLSFVQDVGQGYAFVREITYWMGISGRADEFIQGLICSEDVLYFIIVTAFFLILTVIRLQACRQKSPGLVVLGKYVGVFVVVCFLGFLSSRPALMTYYDATSTNVNTLTKNSQEVVERLNGGFTITTYVNLLDGQGLWEGLPEQIKTDQERFKQYVRFKPEIDMKYVYYYDTIASDAWAEYYPGKNTKQIATEIWESAKLDSTLFLTPEQIRSKVDLSGENNRFVRLLERESGEKTFLRVYDDFFRFPSEAEITAALKRLVMELPNVGFLTGHEERNNKRLGDRDYFHFALKKDFRYALINQGFDVKEVNLQQKISADIKVLVIADMKNEMTELEMMNLKEYIARGGNLLILTEPKRIEVMTPLLAEFGVSMVPGTLVQLTENFSPDLIISKPMKGLIDLNYHFQQMADTKGVVTMPSASGLEYTTDKGYVVTPLLKTDSLVWNEIESEDLLDDKLVCNSLVGEIQKSFVTGLALSRRVGNKEQKVMILSDADCISNAELKASRENIFATNFNIITGGFYWMSDGEVPVDIRRPMPTDDKIYMSEAVMSLWGIIWKWGFSGLFVIVSIFIWVRRRGR